MTYPSPSADIVADVVADISLDIVAGITMLWPP